MTAVADKLKEEVKQVAILERKCELLQEQSEEREAEYKKEVSPSLLSPLLSHFFLFSPLLVLGQLRYIDVIGGESSSHCRGLEEQVPIRRASSVCP